MDMKQRLREFTDMRSKVWKLGAAKGTSCNVEQIKYKSLLRVIRKEVPLTASITVEASIALPLFLFFFANIMMLFNIIKMQCDMEAALHQTGNEMALMAFDERNVEAVAGLEDSGLDTALGAVSVFFAKSKVENYLVEELTKVIVSEGRLDFLSSQIMMGNDYIDIVVGYKAHPLIPIIGFKEFPIEARYYGHAWTGYDISETGSREAQEEEMVFITEHGEVYHKDIGCKHLRLGVRSIDYSSLKSERNADGAKFYPCEHCGNGVAGGNVFITEYGNRFHTTVECPGLKRKIYTIPISEVGGRRPCSTCGG